MKVKNEQERGSKRKQTKRHRSVKTYKGKTLQENEKEHGSLNQITLQGISIYYNTVSLQNRMSVQNYNTENFNWR